MKPANRYDVIVAGGGHAGIEAAAAAARVGARVLLVTLDLDRLGRMSCNPSIGGVGKGHLVREIDALGGLMARATDATGLQFRMLNTAKGPAVRAPRAQSDKAAWPRWMRACLEHEYPGRVDLAGGEVDRVLTDAHGAVRGVVIAGDEEVAAPAVIVAAGTFLNGLIHVGLDSHAGGRWGERASTALTRSLRELGLQTLVLKTGTPARLRRASIGWDSLEQQFGDEPPPPFSYLTDRIDRPRIACALTRTNPHTHEIILEGLDRSPLYTGKIVGTGPRYCPSIETKLERFPGRDSHQVFLEPESLENDLVYVNGVSTSLPADVQDRFLRTIEGLENVEVARWGYGIEYVSFPPPGQIGATLETFAVPGLYLAGQVNGTTGYEEAAGLGLVAGANAALKLRGEAPLLFRRDEAYLGVMIDDLITKGAEEPYRLFTSRAEYRLLLRQDNADLRLTPKGRAAGLVDDARWERFERFREAVDAEQARLREKRVRPGDVAPEDLDAAGAGGLSETVSLERFLARPGVSCGHLVEWGLLEDPSASSGGRPPEEALLRRRVVEQVEVEAAYAGYVERQRRQVERSLGMESAALPAGIDLDNVPSLRKEAAESLRRRRPATLGQAARLPGVNPADIAALAIHLKRRADH